MPPSSPDTSSFQMPHIDTVMTCNAADSSGLTQPYAVATSSDYISCRRSSVSQNAVTPMRDYGSRIQVLVADTSSVSISILVIDFDIMQCHGCHHCTISHFRLVPEAPRWRTQTGLCAADDHCGIKPVILEKNRTVLLTAGWRTNWRYLTCLHALIVFFRCSRSVVGFVDGCSEALVAAPPPDDAGAWPVEGEVPVEGYLGNSRLEAL